MANYLELSKYEATQRLSLFLKLRKGKIITEQTIKDFEKLMHYMNTSFKDHNDNAISDWRLDFFKNKELALVAIRCQFMEWENGGNCRLSDIDSFSCYGDKKYRVKIKGELRDITKRDFDILQFIIFDAR